MESVVVVEHEVEGGAESLLIGVEEVGGEGVPLLVVAGEPQDREEIALTQRMRGLMNL